MATGEAKEILAQIFSRIGDLSDALSPSTSQGTPNLGNGVGRKSNTEQTVEGEVRRVFGRPCGPEASVSPSETKSATQPVHSHTNAHTNERANERNPFYTARRYLGNKRTGMKSNTGQRGNKKSKNQAGPFTRNVICLRVLMIGTFHVKVTKFSYSKMVI